MWTSVYHKQNTTFLLRYKLNIGWIGLNQSVRPRSAEEAGSRISVNQKAVGQIFRERIYLGVSLGAHL